MAQPILAYIVPVSGGEPPGQPGQPPLGIWGPTDPRPTHPIAPGGAPPVIWGPPGPWPQPPYHPGGQPPVISGGLPWPTPPIYLPPVEPGAPTHPIVLPPTVPGYPSHPIVLPEPPPSPPAGEGRWVFVPGLGWVWQPAQSDKPHPPQTPA